MKMATKRDSQWKTQSMEQLNLVTGNTIHTFARIPNPLYSIEPTKNAKEILLKQFFFSFWLNKIEIGYSSSTTATTINQK